MVAEFETSRCISAHGLFDVPLPHFFLHAGAIAARSGTDGQVRGDNDDADPQHGHHRFCHRMPREGHRNVSTLSLPNLHLKLPLFGEGACSRTRTTTEKLRFGLGAQSGAADSLHRLLQKDISASTENGVAFQNSAHVIVDNKVLGNITRRIFVELLFEEYLDCAHGEHKFVWKVETENSCDCVRSGSVR